MLHSSWINGNLAFWETQQCRIVEAYGAGVIKYLNHFVALPLDNTTRNPMDWMRLHRQRGGHDHAADLVDRWRDAVGD